MVVDGIILVVVIASLGGVAVFRRRSHDEVHSVEGYHRQIHTLEVISEHPPGAEAGVVVAHKHAYPESAVRLTDSATVRVSEGPPATVPSPEVPPVIPPPRVKKPDGPITFDDHPDDPPSAPAAAATGWQTDPAIGSMNHRPRRLAAPALAVVGVLALVAILIAYGAHSTIPNHHHGATRTDRTTSTIAAPRTTTTTQAPALPVVSSPLSNTGFDASYEVADNTYSLVLSATSGECWVNVENSTGASIYTGLLEPGQTQTVPATGLVSVVVGAPSSFAATVDGTAVTLPKGYETPLTLHFTPAASASA